MEGTRGGNHGAQEQATDRKLGDQQTRLAPRGSGASAIHMSYQPPTEATDRDDRFCALEAVYEDSVDIRPLLARFESRSPLQTGQVPPN